MFVLSGLGSLIGVAWGSNNSSAKNKESTNMPEFWRGDKRGLGQLNKM